MLASLPLPPDPLQPTIVRWSPLGDLEVCVGRAKCHLILKATDRVAERADAAAHVGKATAEVQEP